MPARAATAFGPGWVGGVGARTGLGHRRRHDGAWVWPWGGGGKINTRWMDSVPGERVHSPAVLICDDYFKSKHCVVPLVSRAVLSWLLTNQVILMHWAMPNLLLVVNIVYCLVPIGYCLLPITYCIRPIGYTRQTDGSQDGCNHKMDAFDKYIYIYVHI